MHGAMADGDVLQHVKCAMRNRNWQSTMDNGGADAMRMWVRNVDISVVMMLLLGLGS